MSAAGATTLCRWRGSIRHALWWLDRQPWQVKGALIALPLLVLAAYFGVLRDLATLVRAIGDAWRNK